MARRSTTGIRGYYVDDDGRRRIDLRYVDAQGRKQRHKEAIPPGTPARAAEARAREVLAAAVTKTLAPRQVGPEVVTLGAAFDQYLEWRATNRPKNLRRMKSIKAAFLATVGDVPITELTPDLIEVHKGRRLALTAAPATVNKDVRTVKHMARIAVKMGWAWMTRERAALLREVEMLTEPPGRQRPIKPAELTALFAAFTRDDSRFARRVTLAALLTGMRLGEIVSLTDVDVGRAELTLRTTKQNRVHAVTVTPELRELIDESLSDPVRKKRDCAYVFCNRFVAGYTVDGFSKQFAKVAERAGCPDITFHDLRRHVGTTLINRGVDLKTVSKLLGHATTAPTERSYAHLTTAATRGAAALMARSVPKPRSTARAARGASVARRKGSPDPSTIRSPGRQGARRTSRG